MKISNLAGLAALLLIACGGDDFLDKDTVTELPPGTATGSRFTGQYEVELYTSDCSGECPVIDYDWFTYTICDVGMKDEEDIGIVHSAGHLQIDADNSLPVTRLTGGIDADGQFDVGGWSTQEGGDVEIVARVLGTIAPDGSITATAHLYANGNARDEHIACRGTFEIRGQSPGN